MLTWVVLRAAGIAAYLMLWATVTWGLIGTTALVGKRVARATAISVHQFLANAALLLLGVHVGGLLLDSYMHFALIDIVAPLHTTHRTVPVAVGILSMSVFMVVLVSLVGSASTSALGSGERRTSWPCRPSRWLCCTGSSPAPIRCGRGRGGATSSREDSSCSSC